MDDIQPTEQIRALAKHDAYRQISDFSDLLKIVASYYDMYSRAVQYVGPWISRQQGKTHAIPIDKDEIKRSLGKERPTISSRARNAFIDSVHSYIIKNKYRRALITPSPSSHHSAQFPEGTFSITMQDGTSINLMDDKAPRQKQKTVHRIEFAGAEQSIYIVGLKFDPKTIKHVILRPKLGKLGMPSVSRWEVLLYNKPYGFIVDHVDSHVNPRWAGII